MMVMLMNNGSNLKLLKHGSLKIGYNGLRLGEVGDFENKTLKLLLMLNRIKNVQ
jgi:hypothetical protein